MNHIEMIKDNAVTLKFDFTPPSWPTFAGNGLVTFDAFQGTGGGVVIVLGSAQRNSRIKNVSAIVDVYSTGVYQYSADVLTMGFQNCNVAKEPYLSEIVFEKDGVFTDGYQQNIVKQNSDFQFSVKDGFQMNHLVLLFPDVGALTSVTLKGSLTFEYENLT